MTRRLALWAGLLAMMAAGSAAPGLRTMETEEVDEWAALEQAMAMAGATGNTTATAPRVTHAVNSTGAGGAVANARADAGVDDLEDLEDCVIGEGSSRRCKRRRSEEERKLTPLELCASRGRHFVFVTEICSQVRACPRRSRQVCAACG
jgi:hypothetical protein